MRTSTSLICLSLAMTVVWIVLEVGLMPRQKKLLAERAQKQWDTLRDDEAASLARSVAMLGPDGVKALVEGLTSRRTTVVESVREVLCGEVDRWQRLPAAEASRRFALLAESLAERADQFGPTARRTAASLAMRALLGASPGAGVDRSRLVADCRRVLRASRGPPALAAGELRAKAMWPDERRGGVQLATFDESRRESTPATLEPLFDCLLGFEALEREPCAAPSTLQIERSVPLVLRPDPAAVPLDGERK